ncbi:hypothetical protein ELE66_31030, partial [Klebsiella pneumoniae]|nr:hypothetical protein [Klebsiella pneumoniae]
QLKPNTRYYYTCGNDKYGWSQEFSFVTASRNTSSLRTVILGDMGTVNSKDSIASILHTQVLDKANEPQFIYHIGDLSYADNYPGIQYESKFNEF